MQMQQLESYQEVKSSSGTIQKKKWLKLTTT
jgi:hypothetical protein